ncbi:hypothetical protein DB346_23150 [Verrucomicrobia bacterium LW23]|nr:hypothetical protein DB346_23150 [Verrucomicrobia bacterium LW23]
MSPTESLEAFSRRVEQTTAKFSAALTRVAEHMPVFSQKLQVRVDEDLDTCIILRFSDVQGHEAALSLEPDFGSSQVVVVLLLEENAHGDLTAFELCSPDPVAEGILRILSHFSKPDAVPAVD